MEWRLRRGLGIPLETTEQSMKDICHDNRCTDCTTEAPSYQAICINFFLECLRIRCATWSQFNQVNRYDTLPGWPSDLTVALARYVEIPIRFWLDETWSFYSFGDRLVSHHEPVIKPTEVDKDSKAESRLYLSHSKSIQRVILSIRKCDAAPV